MKRRALFGCRLSILGQRITCGWYAGQSQADQKKPRAFTQWAFAGMTGVRLRVWHRSITMTAGADQPTDNIFYRFDLRKDFRARIGLAAVTNEHHRAIIGRYLIAR